MYASLLHLLLALAILYYYYIVLLCFYFFFFLMIRRPPRSTLFPTRRSSDLGSDTRDPPRRGSACGAAPPSGDRKSTRLNSSHRTISYAVFCLKKKTNTQT